MKTNKLFFSCEHAVNTIPPEYADLFIPYQSLMNTHRAIDFGALDIARHLSKSLGCELIAATATRLLIDCNRSLHDAHCFSEVTKSLPIPIKKTIIEQYYAPYRQQVMDQVKTHIDNNFQLIHLSIHSFTPILNNVTRNNGIGLLYDSGRHGEKEVARLWRGVLEHQNPVYRVRMNYPYLGKTDGLVTVLRKKHSEVEYLGFEVEINQELVEDATCLSELKTLLTTSLEQLLQIL